MKRFLYKLSLLAISMALLSCDKPASIAKTQAAATWYVRPFMGPNTDWRLLADLGNPPYGMFELTQFPNRQATDAEKKAADIFIAKTYAAVKAKGWLNKEKALADGYANMYKDKIHYVKKDFLYDGKTLDPEAPEFLMYYPSDKGELLMGVMFVAEEHGPQIAGPLSLWHFHIEKNICYENNFLPIGELNDDGQCLIGNLRKHSPEMLHVWFFDHPDGRFATRMRLTPEQFELAKQQVLREDNIK